MIHGTTHAYNKGCRCSECKDAKSEANRLMRGKLPPKTGKRGRKKKQISAWEYTVVWKDVKKASAWEYWVKCPRHLIVKKEKVKKERKVRIAKPKPEKPKIRRKQVSAWSYTVKQPRVKKPKVIKIKKRIVKMSVEVKLSRFETAIDIMRFARYATGVFNVRDLRACVTDLSSNVVNSILAGLVDDGYIQRKGEKDYFRTQKLVGFFKEVE